MVQATATKAYGDFTGNPNYMPSPEETRCAYQLGANAVIELNNTGDAMGYGLTDAFKRAGVDGLKVLKENQGNINTPLTSYQTEWYERIKMSLPEGQTEEFFKGMSVAGDQYATVAEREMAYEYALDVIDKMIPMTK